MTWNNFPTATPGFDACTSFFFGTNSITGTLPPLMGNVPRAASAAFRVMDNNITGAD